MFIKPRVYYLDFCVSISEESRLLTVFFGLAGVSDPSVGNFEALRLAHFWLVVGSPRVKIFPNFRGGSIEKCLSWPPTSHMSHETLDDHLVLWNNEPFASRRHVWMSEKKVLPYYIICQNLIYQPPLERKKKKNYISKKNSKVTTSFS